MDLCTRTTSYHRDRAVTNQCINCNWWQHVDSNWIIRRNHQFVCL